MSETKVFSARVAPKILDELNELKKEDGGTPAEFMIRMASAYKLHREARTLPLAQQDVADLQTHLAAIEGVFCGLLLRMRTQISASEQDTGAIVDEIMADLTTEKARAAEQQASLLERLAQGETALRSSETARKVAEKDREDLSRREAGLTEALRVAQELATQYKAKAEALAADAEPVAALRSTLLDTRKAAATAQDALEAAESRHKAAMAETEATHRQEVLTLRERHQDAMEAIRRDHATELREARNPASRKKPVGKEGEKGIA